MLYTYNRLSGNTNVSKPSLALTALVIGILALILSSYLVYDRYDGPFLEKDTLRKENVEAKAMFIVKDLKSKIERWKEEHENSTKTDKDIIQDVMYKPQSDNIVSQLDATGVKTPALKINDLESINRTQINVNHPLRISTLLEREDFRGISMPNTLFIDTLKEYTLKAGIDIEGTLFRDGNVYTDNINEKTTGAGVTIDGVLIKDGLVDGVDISTLSPTSISTDLIPTTDSTYDLGSPTHYWSNAYIDTLFVSGTITSVNQLEVDDPILKLNNGAIDDTNDIGFYGQHDTNRYSGLVRDTTDNYWTFFENITTEPTTTVSIGSSYGNMRVGHIAAGQDSTYDLGASGTRWANIYTDALDATNITGTLQTAAQGNITSLGTLTALTVDNINLDGSNVTYSGTTGNNLITVTDNLASALSITDGTQEYLRIVSTTSSDTVKLMQDTTVFGSIEIDDLLPDGNGMYNGVFLSRAVANFIGMDIGYNANVPKFNYRFSAPSALDIVFATHDGNPTVQSDFNIQMTIDGSNGYVGMGVEDPLTRLHIEDTSTQLRLDYNSSNRTTFTVNSSGDLTIDPTGGDVTFDSNILVSTDSTRDIGASGTRWANIYADALDATNVTGTLQTAAQSNVTSLGTLTALTVDNINLDGSNVTYSGTTGNNLITVPDNLASALSITDGTQEYLRIVSTTSSDQINLLQNTEITGHLTTGTDSTYNIGASGTRWSTIYGDTLDAPTITDGTATLTSGGLTGLTNLTVDNININGNTISTTSGNLILDATSNVGIGTTTPDAAFEIEKEYTGTGLSSTAYITNNYSNGSGTRYTDLTFRLTDSVGTRKDACVIQSISNNQDSSTGANLVFLTRTADSTPTEKMRLDNNGRLGINRTPTNFQLEVLGACHFGDNFDGTDYSVGGVQITKDSTSAVLLNLVRNGFYWWGLGYDYNTNDFGIHRQPSTTESNNTSPVFKLDASDDATFKNDVIVTTHLGVGATPSYPLHVESNTTGRFAYMDSTTESFADNMMQMDCYRSASSAYNFIICNSDSNGTPDAEFKVRGDGEVYGDGASYNSGADYAEFFESSDGKAIEKGYSLVLDSGKVRIYNPETDTVQDIIGVSRSKAPGKHSCMIGNSAALKWSKKYLSDEWGDYLMEDYQVYRWTDKDQEKEWCSCNSLPDNETKESLLQKEDLTVVTQQRKKLNPDYNSNQDYISRKYRDEWILVGLVGQVLIRSHQAVNPRWRKMTEISNNVHRYFIR